MVRGHENCFGGFAPIPQAVRNGRVSFRATVGFSLHPGFFILHYGIYLVLLCIVDWVHGLATFGIGVLLFVFLPIAYRTYLGIFKRSAMRVYRLDPATGRLMIKMLSAKKANSTSEVHSDSMKSEQAQNLSEK